LSKLPQEIDLLFFVTGTLVLPAVCGVVETFFVIGWKRGLIATFVTMVTWLFLFLFFSREIKARIAAEIHRLM
jgi:uncharacterized membrane protein